MYALLALVAAGAALGKALTSSGTKRVFVSYDHDQDCRYRDLLRAWDRNEKFDFEWELASPIVAVNSNAAGVIKTSLTKKLKNSEYLLVVVGPETRDSEWIDWELNRAMREDVNLKIAAIKVNARYHLPAAIRKKNIPYRIGFTLDNVKAVLEEARALH